MIMKNMLQVTSVCSLAMLLAACGGGNSETATTKNSLLAMRGASGAGSPQAQHVPAEYTDLIQRIYLAFFGRAADPKGLEFWGQTFSDSAMPIQLDGLIAGYSSNVRVRDLIDMFANSAESQGLYTGNNAAFINAVYLNVFNRNAEFDGLSFWSGFLDRGQITRAQAAMWILSGAQNDDATVVKKKVQAATYFTGALDTSVEILSYTGDSPNQALRDLFATITAATDMTAFQAEIDAFIASMQNIPGTFPVSAFYVGYNYLQAMTNEPSYSARYSYGAGGVVGPATTGTLTFGEVPQSIGWVRGAGTQFIYNAPVTSSMPLPVTGNGVLPVLTMLCRTLTGATVPSGGIVKSTDVLVARSARRLTDASQLAGQTLTVYREDCAIGGSNVESFAFDGAGNGSFKSAAGVVTMTAASVTGLLKGDIVMDLTTGKYLVFTGYSYTRLDGTLGYVIVQHLSTSRTGLTDGILSIWSQD
jgi:hypothetical protein